jgi:hypothetical protein
MKGVIMCNIMSVYCAGALVVLLNFIEGVYAEEKTAPSVHWLAEDTELATKSVIVLKTGDVALTGNRMVFSLFLQNADLTNPAPIVDAGEMYVYIYMKAPNGNHPFYVKEVPRPIDGVVSFLDEIPLVLSPVRIVVLARNGTKVPLLCSAVLVTRN